MTEVLKIIIFDLGIFWRYMLGAAGKDPDAAFNQMLALVKRLSVGFDRIIIAADSGKSFRARIDPKYKANRPARLPWQYEQLRRLKERLVLDGCHLFEAPEWTGAGERYWLAGNATETVFLEADDVMRTVCEWARERRFPVRIVTSDKDLLQLVDDEAGIEVQRPETGDILRADDVISKLGIPPAKVVQWLALAGDDSDNFKPYPGVGDKTAIGWLRQWDTAVTVVEELLKRDGEGKPLVAGAKEDKVRVGGLEPALRGVDLATLRAVPMNCNAILEKREPKPITEATWSAEERKPPSSPPASSSPPSGPRATEPAAKTPPNEPPAAQSAALAVRQSTDFRIELEPRTPEQAFTMAKHLANSRLFALETTEQVFAAMLMARSLGVDIITILRGVHVIEGRLALHASLITALVIRSGKADYFRLVKSTDEEAVYKTHRKDDPDPEPTVFRFTIEEAQRANYTYVREGKRGGNWQKIPRTMLRHRCATELARAVYPDVVMCLYTPDELSGGQSEIFEAEFLEEERNAA
jgi:5'-3' exonuclease